MRERFKHELRNLNIPNSSVQTPKGLELPPQVTKSGNEYVLRADPGVRVQARSHKMSKSRGNVINPDDVVCEYGADSLRLYEMFMGPLKETKVWSTNGVEGVHRFLARAWRLIVGQKEGADVSVTEGEPSEEQLRTLHACIQKVRGFRARVATTRRVADLLIVSDDLIGRWRYSEIVPWAAVTCLLAAYGLSIPRKRGPIMRCPTQLFQPHRKDAIHIQYHFYRLGKPLAPTRFQCPPFQCTLRSSSSECKTLTSEKWTLISGDGGGGQHALQHGHRRYDGVRQRR